MPETPYDPDAKRGQRGSLTPYVSPFGKPEGMADRLRDHVKKLGTDKSLPWVGLGLIDDLRCAATMIDGKPSPLPHSEARAEVFAETAARSPRPTNDPAPVNSDVEDWERALPAAPVEFDL